MKPYTLLAIVLLWAGKLTAQNVAKLYASPQDYLAGRYDTTHTLSQKQLRDGTYELKAYKWETRNAIQSKVWAVERNDSLWVNTKLVLAPQKQYVARRGGERYHHKNYELVRYATPNYLQFSGKRANVKNMYGKRADKNNPDVMERFGELPPIVKALGVRYEDEPQAPRYNYIYMMRSGETVHLNRGNVEEYYWQSLQVRDTAFSRYLLKLGKEQGYAH